MSATFGESLASKLLANSKRGRGRAGRGGGRITMSKTQKTAKPKEPVEKKKCETKSKSAASSTPDLNRSTLNTLPISMKFVPEQMPANATSNSVDMMVPAKVLFQASKGFKLHPAMDIEMTPGKPIVMRSQLKQDPPMWFETYIAPCPDIPSNCQGKIYNPFQPPFDYDRDKSMSSS